nr:hypothetical protein CFP56_54665 [Quercus suber]
MAVQRQTAASRSTSPESSEQHGVSGGDPMTVPTAPLSTLAQTPSFSASLGQLCGTVVTEMSHDSKVGPKSGVDYAYVI